MTSYNKNFLTNARREFIRAKVRQVHQKLWDECRSERALNPNFSSVSILNPGKALQLLGYKLSTRNLEDWHDGEWVQVAGMVDRASKEVTISNAQQHDAQLFTIAHELGHVVLHPYMAILHRDRPVKQTLQSHDIIEREANYFAAEFLAPEKLLRDEFQTIFGEAPFALNDHTAFALCASRLEVIQKKLRTRRDLSRYLAETISYNGCNFDSLKKRFMVSTDVLAIQLEQHGLVAEY